MLLKAWLCHSLLDMKLCSGTLSRIVCAVSEDRMRRCKKHLSQSVCVSCLHPVCCQNDVSLQNEDSGEISGFSAVNDECFRLDCQRGFY